MDIGTRPQVEMALRYARPLWDSATREPATDCFVAVRDMALGVGRGDRQPHQR